MKVYMLCKQGFLTLIIPRFNGFHWIHNAHIKYCNLYGFNVIDMNEYYVERNMFEFWCYSLYDGQHQPKTIMYNLGANIVNHLEDFAYPKENLPKSALEFKVLNPKNMICGEVNKSEIIHKKDLFSNENIKEESRVKLS